MYNRAIKGLGLGLVQLIKTSPIHYSSLFSVEDVVIFSNPGNCSWDSRRQRIPLHGSLLWPVTPKTTHNSSPCWMCADVQVSESPSRPVSLKMDIHVLAKISNIASQLQAVLVYMTEELAILLAIFFCPTCCFSWGFFTYLCCQPAVYKNGIKNFG